MFVAALPSDVRKAYGLPVTVGWIRGYAPIKGAAQNYRKLIGSAEPFRTSNGRAVTRKAIGAFGSISIWYLPERCASNQGSIKEPPAKIFHRRLLILPHALKEVWGITYPCRTLPVACHLLVTQK